MICVVFGSVSFRLLISLLAVMLWTRPSFAGLVVLPRSGQVVVESKDGCKEVDELSKKFAAPACGKKIKGGWFSSTCQVDIASCLPQMVRDLHGVKAQINGLNSFSSVLFISGLLPSLRHSTREELNFYLHSPACKKGEGAPQAMDILVLVDGDGDEMQAATLLDGAELVFTKSNPLTHESYLVQSKEKFLAANKSDDPQGLQTQTYRCQTQDVYLKGLPVELQRLHRHMNEIELILSQPLPVKVTVTVQQSQEMLAKLKQIIQDLKLYQKTALADAKGASGLVIRLMSLKSHLQENAKSVVESEVELKKPLIDLLETSFSSTEK